MKIVVTETEFVDDNTCKCQSCNKTIAEFINDIMKPSAEECYKLGHVPIPNFGWFCSQNCGLEYEQKHKVHFKKDQNGRISYYNL